GAGCCVVLHWDAYLRYQSFFFQAEDGIRDKLVTGVQTCALPICPSDVGRPKSLRLYKAVEAACMYLRQNATQEFIGDMRDTSQPTISRYVAELVPIVKSVLEDFVPSAADAIEVVKGRVVLVDGTLTPCW